MFYRRQIRENTCGHLPHAKTSIPSPSLDLEQALRPTTNVSHPPACPMHCLLLTPGSGVGRDVYFASGSISGPSGADLDCVVWSHKRQLESKLCTLHLTHNLWWPVPMRMCVGCQEKGLIQFVTSYWRVSQETSWARWDRLSHPNTIWFAHKHTHTTRAATKSYIIICKTYLQLTFSRPRDISRGQTDNTTELISVVKIWNATLTNLESTCKRTLCVLNLEAEEKRKRRTVWRCRRRKRWSGKSRRNKKKRKRRGRFPFVLFFTHLSLTNTGRNRVADRVKITRFDRLKVVRSPCLHFNSASFLSGDFTSQRLEKYSSCTHVLGIRWRESAISNTVTQ